MPFDCGATGYVPLDPPGDLGGLGVADVDSITEGEDGLDIVVSGEVAGKPVRVRILFEYLFAYCVSNESYRLRAAHQIVSLMGPASLLHRVEGSEWVERFRREAGGVLRDDEPGLEHYLIVTGSDWVDVIGSAPGVVFLE